MKIMSNNGMKNIFKNRMVFGSCKLACQKRDNQNGFFLPGALSEFAFKSVPVLFLKNPIRRQLTFMLCDFDNGVPPI